MKPRSPASFSVSEFFESPATPIAVQVEATGRGSFAVDHVRVGPDLPGFFRQRSRALEALGG